MSVSVRLPVLAMLGFLCFAGEAQMSTVASLKSGSSFASRSGIQMIDRLRGWANSNEGLWSTTDGGATWTRSRLRRVLPAASWGVLSDGTAWGLLNNPMRDPSVEIAIVSARGNVDHRVTPCSPKIDCYSGSAAFSRDGQNGIFAGIIQGDREHDRSKGYRTRDGGRTWEELSMFPSWITRGDLTIVAEGEDHLLVVTGCDLYTTSDFGSTWAKAHLKRPAVMCSGDSNPYNIRFFGWSNGWLRTNDGWILRSEDGGGSWAVSSLGHQRIFFPKVYDSWISFADANNGLAVVQGELLLTKDGGYTWTNIPNSEEERFLGVSCAGEQCIVSSDRRISAYLFR